MPEVALIFGRDQRTVRTAIEKGQIPASRLGQQWHIPTSWIRQQVGKA